MGLIFPFFSSLPLARTPIFHSFFHPVFPFSTCFYPSPPSTYFFTSTTALLSRPPTPENPEGFSSPTVKTFFPNPHTPLAPPSGLGPVRKMNPIVCMLECFQRAGNIILYRGGVAPAFLPAQLLELPVPVVQGAHVAALEPALDAVEVKGVVCAVAGERGRRGWGAWSARESAGRGGVG